jgi:hypothetical protein
MASSRMGTSLSACAERLDHVVVVAASALGV